METIYVQMPINKRYHAIDEEQQQRQYRRNPQFENLENFITPLENRQHKSNRFPRKCHQTERFTNLFRHQQSDSEEEEEDQQERFQPRQQLCQNRRFFQQFVQKQQRQQQQQQPWFTVVPLQGMVRPEEIMVKLNPQCHMLIIKVTPQMSKQMRRSQFRDTNTTTTEIHRIITLPKTICMEKLQVKLNKRGELIVIAPFKHQMQGRQSSEMLPPFFGGERDTQQWFTIPINKSQGSFNKTRQPFFPHQGEDELSQSSSSSESESESELSSNSSEEEGMTSTYSTESKTESDTETETGSESETEENNIMEQLEHINIRTTTKVQVQKFVQLLEKVFYPNIVMVKLIRGTVQQKQQLQVAVNIKFVDFQTEEIKVRMHETRRVLVVEGKKIRKVQRYGAALKYVRREIQLPQLFNLNKIVYRVLPNGILRIKLPFVAGKIQGQSQTHQQQMKQFLPQFARKSCNCNYFTRNVQPKQLRKNKKVVSQRRPKYFY